jgi:DNA-binding CsgD family transcriptional regulator
MPAAPTPVGALITEGRDAFRRGDGAASRSAFEAVLAVHVTGEALEGLARALYLEVDYVRSMEAHEHAYAAYRQAGDRQGAARAARMLAWLHGALYGDWAVGNGWLGRARRFLEEAGEPSGEHGWVELTRAMSEPDARKREEHFRAALAIGRRFGDPDLEFESLGWVGVELVMRDQVEEGMALLDEALAAVCAGEVDDLYVVEGTFCSMFSACERAHDVARAEQWIRMADELAQRRNLIAIGAFCRAHYAGILTAGGRWQEAEAELAAALRVFERGHPAMRENVLVRLAHLRVQQGRLDEATQLLEGLDRHPDAVVPLAVLCLTRGEVALARDLLERALARPDLDSAAAGPLLALLVDSHLGGDALDEAAGAADRLTVLATRRSTHYLLACAAWARGKVCAATGGGEARSCFLEAIAAFSDAQMPAELARARLDLARAVASDQPEVAVAEAKAALEIFERLGAVRDADAATALLRSLGVVSRVGAKMRGQLTRREAEVFELLSHGLSNPEIADRLFISAKTAEHHVGRVLSKLGLRNRTEAAAYAARMAGGRTRE